jgi:hypothetical protein
LLHEAVGCPFLLVCIPLYEYVMIHLSILF